MATKALAQSEASNTQHQLLSMEIPPLSILNLTAIANEDYTLIDDEGQNLGEMTHPLGKDDLVSCGFCGTSEDGELPFDADKMEWDGRIEVFPNPTTEYFYIRGGNYLLNVQLLAMDGRLVRSIVPTADAINVDDLAPGVYLLQMDNGARVINRKLVVQ
jgi:hypothetical protein